MSRPSRSRCWSGTPDAIAVGTVTVDSGSTTVCQFSLSSVSSGSCALAAAALPPGTAQLTASYAGSADLGFAPSVSSAEPLTVAKEPTTTAVSLSAAKVAYGAEQRERISVAVKPPSAAPRPGRSPSRRAAPRSASSR